MCTVFVTELFAVFDSMSLYVTVSLLYVYCSCCCMLQYVTAFYNMFTVFYSIALYCLLHVTVCSSMFTVCYGMLLYVNVCYRLLLFVVQHVTVCYCILLYNTVFYSICLCILLYLCSMLIVVSPYCCRFFLYFNRVFQF